MHLVLGFCGVILEGGLEEGKTQELLESILSISIQLFVRTIAPNGADMPETYNNLIIAINKKEKNYYLLKYYKPNLARGSCTAENCEN